MLGRNLYDTHETYSNLEIRLALYCRIFEEMNSSFFIVADVFTSSCIDASHFDVDLILYFLQCRYKNKNIRMRTVKQCIEMGMK